MGEVIILAACPGSHRIDALVDLVTEAIGAPDVVCSYNALDELRIEDDVAPLVVVEAGVLIGWNHRCVRLAHRMGPSLSRWVALTTREPGNEVPGAEPGDYPWWIIHHELRISRDLTSIIGVVSDGADVSHDQCAQHRAAAVETLQQAAAAAPAVTAAQIAASRAR